VAGNFLSGRRGSGRGIVERAPALDVGWLQRKGFLKPSEGTVRWTDGRGEETASIAVRSDGKELRLLFRYRRRGRDWQDVSLPIAIAWTACHFGGRRPWLACPACGRRVAKLYLGSRLFCCRPCNQLDYRCQRQTRFDQALGQFNKIQEQLGGEPGLWRFLPRRPKGMHVTTYRRHLARAQHLLNRMVANWPAFAACYIEETLWCHGDLDRLVPPGPTKRPPA
jgi:hypothetical protein